MGPPRFYQKQNTGRRSGRAHNHRDKARGSTSQVIINWPRNLPGQPYSYPGTWDDRALRRAGRARPLSLGTVDHAWVRRAVVSIQCDTRAELMG
ncbi:hypothetical protein FJTKL_03182 [Diaporthe vaccinii]|uniref:Transposase n=1 Tax=Diaporthe vaccinii TaxID=105482 RepID=A0ABR4DX78_9PEZI